MTKYARIEYIDENGERQITGKFDTGIVVEIVDSPDITEQFSPKLCFVKCTASVKLGYIYNKGKFTEPVIEEVEDDTTI